MTREIKNETDALKEAGRKTCLKHVHAWREGDVWYCIPCTDSILTPRPYTIIKVEQNEEETKMTNEEKKEVEDPCKDKKNCRGCAHYDGMLCPRNMAAEEFKDNPAFFIAMFLIGIYGVIWLFNH